MSENAVSNPSIVARRVSDPASAHAHLLQRLSVEYAAAHVPGAISLPYRLIDEEAVAGLPAGLLVAGSARYAPDLSGLITLPREAARESAAPSTHEPPHTG